MNIEKKILRSIDSLILWRNIRCNSILIKLERLLNNMLKEDCHSLIDDYYSLFHAFIEKAKWDGDIHSWQNYIKQLVELDENQFSLKAERLNFQDIPMPMVNLAKQDLERIEHIIKIPWDLIIRKIEDKLGQSIEPIFKKKTKKESFLNLDIEKLAEKFNTHGCGQFGVYRGFRWNVSKEGRRYLEGIENIDAIELEDLVGYDIQKKRLIENTKLLLSGYSANNVLLYGDKGTGKSSMVKAILNRYYNRGLRAVEVPKDNLEEYYDILSILENRGLKFIIFIDDLSFEESESEYKHIKALLEGGLKERPKNVVIYATSNRRHLIRQSFDDRDEVTPADAIQEKLSLSDRFGITLTFMSPSQKEYIAIVKNIAASRGLTVDEDYLIESALSWSMRYNGTSGRTARQFIDHLEGLTAINVH